MSNAVENGEGALREALGARLLSDREFAEGFEALLAQPPYADFAFRFVVRGPGDAAVAALESRDIPAGKETRAETHDGEAVKVDGKVWRRPEVSRSPPPNALVEGLFDLICKHWDGRDPMTGLPFVRVPGVVERFVASAQHAAPRGELAVLHMDLDFFKAVNTDHGLPAGDQVLTEFGARVRETFGEVGVVARAGGEEFTAIVPGLPPDKAVERIEAFLSQMATKDFAAIGRPNTCSIGVALYSPESALPDLSNVDNLLRDAASASRKAKDDGRNCLRLFGGAPNAALCAVDRAQLVRVALEARRLLKAPASNAASAFMRGLAQRLADQFAAEPQTPSMQHAQELRRRLGLQIGVDVAHEARPAWRLGVLNPLEWVTVLVAALLDRSAPGDHVCLLATADELRILARSSAKDVDECVIEGVSCAASIEIDAGGPEYDMGAAPPGGVERWAPEHETAEDRNPRSPVLLLPIGDEAADVSEPLRRLAADVIHVDDRPATGGGLPDFWQSNLAQVLRAALANPNITVIAAIGEPDSAKLTLDRLRGTGLDDLEVQRRLGLSAKAFQLFRARGLEIRQVRADAEAILDVMLEAARSPSPADLAARERVVPEQESSRRRLPMPQPDASTRLTLYDGLRTRTLGEAYPQAIQLIRSAVEGSGHRELSRREFRELTGFKLVLTQPLPDRVPDYWDSERDLLAGYYQSQFVDRRGVFGRSLRGCFGEAQEVRTYMLEQTARAVLDRQPTRRLNIPVLPQHLGQPLGLTAIQLMPRFDEGRVHLGALWIWRTVDALVGFPFSAYGSISWTDDFVRDLQERVHAEQPDCRVEMGELTYVALSFHMYLHQGDQEIARAIVQDASR